MCKTRWDRLENEENEIEMSKGIRLDEDTKTADQKVWRFQEDVLRILYGKLYSIIHLSVILNTN